MAQEIAYRCVLEVQTYVKPVATSFANAARKRGKIFLSLRNQNSSNLEQVYTF